MHTSGYRTDLSGLVPYPFAAHIRRFKAHSRPGHVRSIAFKITVERSLCRMVPPSIFSFNLCAGSAPLRAQSPYVRHVLTCDKNKRACAIYGSPLALSDITVQGQVRKPAVFEMLYLLIMKPRIYLSIGSTYFYFTRFYLANWAVFYSYCAASFRALSHSPV